jgi:transposase
MQRMEAVDYADISEHPTVVGLRSENRDLTQRLTQVTQQLEWFKRQIFGRKSERRLEFNPDQMDISLLFGEMLSLPPEKTEEVRYTRRAKQRDESCVTEAGLRFDDNVPVEVIEIPAPELKGPDAEQYVVIDEKITRRLAQRPGSYVVLEYRRPVVKHKESGAITAPAAPTAVLDNCMADVSLIAGLLVDKFLYHLPLYRQHQRLKDAGIQLSRATLTYYTQRAIDLLAPIHQAQLQHILESRVLAMDETPIKAGREDKGKMHTAWYWPIYGEDHEISFTWSPSRGANHVKEQLRDFKGVLLSDGYGAYDSFARDKPEVTRAQCWAHTRRYFERAQDADPAAMKALEHIGALYRIEAQIRDKNLSGEDKLLYRSRHAHPLVDTFFGWCREQRARIDLTNSSPLAKALLYAENHQAQLRIYLGDPDVPIDTNHLERALRTIPMGRKNWLFCWTEVGAKHVGIIQSLLTTCRLHGADPYAYLVDVLQRIAIHPARDVLDLTPRCWQKKYAGNPLRSDLYGLGQ